MQRPQQIPLNPNDPDLDLDAVELLGLTQSELDEWNDRCEADAADERAYFRDADERCDADEIFRGRR